MGTSKHERQNRRQQALFSAPTGKRKTPFSSVTNNSNDNTRKISEFKRIGPNKKQKKRGSYNGGNQKSPEKVEYDDVIQQPSALQKLSYFVHEYRSAHGVQLSSLEVDSLKGYVLLLGNELIDAESVATTFRQNDTCMLDIYQETTKNTSGLGEYVKCAFRSSWKEMLCGKQLKEGKVESGNPVVIVVASSAQRSLELLKELQPLTKECPAVKLFSKHMKLEEQVGLLKNHVNIACGTPSRIKKLIDMDALGLSRLALVVLDMYRDVKGYSLLTLPQVREEFWQLYQKSFHEKLVGGHLRIRLYGNIPAVAVNTVEATDV